MKIPRTQFRSSRPLLNGLAGTFFQMKASEIMKLTSQMMLKIAIHFSIAYRIMISDSLRRVT